MRYLCSLLFIFNLSLSLLQAELSVASIFGDKMVLQQNQPIPIWGKAKPLAKVEVFCLEQNYSTQADKAGHWEIKLPPLSNRGSFDLKVTSENKSIQFSDVLLGEVWLCAGQSNMWMSLQLTENATREMASGTFPNIRFFRAETTGSFTPLDAVNGSWQKCSAQTSGLQSAVAYYFGKQLHQKLDTPIGLISTSWGGSKAEWWTRFETLKRLDDYDYYLAERQKWKKRGVKKQETFPERAAQWEKSYQDAYESTQGVDQGWHLPECDDSTWTSQSLPYQLTNPLLKKPGTAWFRKRITIPEHWRGQPLLLSLGLLHDYNFTYFNGKLVGKYESPNKEQQRTLHGYHSGQYEALNKHERYVLNGSHAQEGSATLAIRIINKLSWLAGFASEPQDLYIHPIGHPEDRISLAGDWKAISEFQLKRRPKEFAYADVPLFAGTLYNGSIAPLIPYAIKGAIWYQGESNHKNAQHYETLFANMVKNWRDDWKQGDFPFYFVQLANFKERSEEPTDSMWVRLCEAQLKSLDIPNTGMAVTIDIGDAKDIHPRNKKTVGERLAYNALALTYGYDIPYSGPIYQSHKIENDKIIVTFEHAGAELKTSDGQPLTGFALAGEDKKFLWAHAEIKGNTIIVSHPKIKKPVALRYAWASNPQCNLTNDSTLPASPFRTDDWAFEEPAKK